MSSDDTDSTGGADGGPGGSADAGARADASAGTDAADGGGGRVGTGAGTVADQYDPAAVEDRVFEYWEDVDAYEKTVEHRSDGEPFYFVDGPPYTSGRAHMGHAWNKSLKDAYIRYHRMQGYDVYDRPGYDMHGLPIETKVEEELDFEDKKDIESYGVDRFIEECRSFAEESLAGLQDDFRSMGVWMDWENPYRTVSPEYMEAAWWAFKQVHERGLVDQGLRSITQCPRCETAIAKNEVEFHEVEDPSIYVRFPLADREGSLVAWTTTPWTVPANTFVAVGADLTYVAVRARDGEDSEVLYLEESTVEDVLQRGRYEDYEVIEEFAGEQMVGWEYEHPLGDLVDHPGGEGAFEVYTADYVEADRTGLVHSAPGHGEEDFERGRELGLDVFCPVGTDGVYDDRAGPYAGQFVRDANPDIRADLEDRGHLLADETYVHDYGQCWRCDTDIVQIVTDQWFINVTEIKGDLLDNIEDSEWYPDWARDNRFRDFVEEAPDWNVSRQRYWGIPIPIWLPEDWNGDMDEAIVVGTREELADRVDQTVDPAELDLHKPTVDELTITEDGRTYERVPDVFDVWLDSSVATWGTLGYPGSAGDGTSAGDGGDGTSAGDGAAPAYPDNSTDYPDPETAFEELWPADLIIEAHDQTRGWFWSQLGMGTAALDEVPYRQVLMHGFALMPDGRGMSKSRGIVIRPHEAIEKHGVDPLRLFLLSVEPQGEDLRVSWEEMEEMQRRLNILWNVFRFPRPYAEMDGVDPADLPVHDAELGTLDRWVLSRLQSVVAEMDDAWERFEHHKALEAVLNFVVEDLSRYYVQSIRERMWTETMTPGKEAAYATLQHVTETVVALLAPYAPFVTEDLYQRLVGEDGHDSVHMCDWPTPDDALHEPDLERAVRRVRDVEEAGSRARQRAGRKLRWPVERVVVDAGEDAVADAVATHADLLADRLNARTVEVVGAGEDWSELRYAGEADMSELGPAFGDDAPAVMGALNDARVDDPSLSALAAAVAEDLGREVDLEEEMVDVVAHPPEGVEAADADGATVYVDASLSEDIESEGYAREVIRRVQEMRNDLDLEIDARVRVELDVADDRVADLVMRHADLIRRETRAAELGPVEDGDGLRREWDVEGTTVTIAVAPVVAGTA